MTWRVGDLVTLANERHDFGHGFSICDVRGVPLVSFMYHARSDAEIARSLVEAALATAVDIMGHPNRHHHHRL